MIGAAWNGARAFTATSGPGISLMQEFLGLVLFCRDSGGDLRRAARRPFDRHADPHAAMRHHLLRLRLARRHQARAAVPRETRPRAFEFGAQAFDLADRLQTPIFVMLDLDIGMNHRLCQPADLGRQPQIRPRQGDDGGRRSRPARNSAAISTSTATAFPIAPIPARIRPRARSSPAAPRATATRATPKKARLTPTTCSGCMRKFETAKDLVPRPLQANAGKPTKYGVIYFGSTSPAMDEAIELIEARGHALDRMRVRAFPFHSSVDELHRRPRFRVRGRAEPRRAACARSIVNECGIDSGAAGADPAL